MQFDTQSIINRIEANLSAQAGFAQILYNAANMRMITAVAQELSYTAGYHETLLQESKWTTAQNASSLLSQNDVLNYQAHRMIGASGTVRLATTPLVSSQYWNSGITYPVGTSVWFTVSNVDYLYTSLLASNTGNIPNTSPTYWSQVTGISPALNISIPIWSIFQDKGGLTPFTAYSTQSFNIGQNYIDISIVQGTPKSVSYTAQGLVNEQFELDDSTIENNQFDLYVNGILWTPVTSLLEQSSTTQAYHIENIIDFSGIYIEFGDGVYGQKLNHGDQITFYYVSTLGASGNVTSSNIINTINSSLYNTNGTKVTLYCSNLNVLEGGDAVEDIDSIRTNAPEVYQTGNRASSGTDYTAIILDNYSFVSKMIDWGAYEYNIDRGLDPWTFIPAQENVVNISAIDQNGQSLTNSEQLIISAGINAFKAPTDILQYVPVNFLQLAFNVTAFVTNTQYALSSVSNAIRTALSNTYGLANMKFHQSVYFSEYQALISGVPGVDHHDSTVSIIQSFPLQSAYYCLFTLSEFPTKPSSISIYVVDSNTPTVSTLIATDNGLGTLVAQNGYVLSGQVSYVSGLCVITITGGLTDVYTNYSLKVWYQENSSDFVLNNRNDIFEFDSADTVINPQYFTN